MIEVCLDALDACIAAEKAGVHRIELCGNLAEGGTTPSIALVQQVKQHVNLPIHVMVRPRGGDFLYSDAEFKVMRWEILQLRALQVEGIVLGILRPDGTVDQERCQQLVELAQPLDLTFHRAFDMASDPFQAMEDIIALGFNRILTSGQRAKAEEGKDLIAELVHRAGQRIEIMPGGGINATNAKTLLQTGATSLHCSALTHTESAMQYRNNEVGMGNNSAEYQRTTFHHQKIEALLQATT